MSAATKMPKNRFRPSTRKPPTETLMLPQPETPPANPPKHQEPVYLNVYDLARINGYTKSVGLGIYHTGIEVYGTEYGFAGHRTRLSGIFRMTPRNHAELNNSCCYNRSIQLGVTTFTPQEVNEVINELGEYFRGHYYHLTSFNCNHFSNALAQILCGHRIPRWVNRVANIVTVFPILKRLLPKETVVPRKHNRHYSTRHQATSKGSQNQQGPNCNRA